MSYLTYLNKLLSEGTVGDLLKPMSKEEQKELLGDTIQYKVDVMFDEIFEYLESNGYVKVAINRYMKKTKDYLLTFFNNDTPNKNTRRIVIYLYVYNANADAQAMIDEHVTSNQDIKEVKEIIIDYIKNHLDKDLVEFKGVKLI
jgi:RNA-binding protein YhbY